MLEQPKRPDTPPDEAILAIEMAVNVLMTLFATSQPNAEEFIQASRQSALRAFTLEPLVDPRGRRIAEHMDWMLATAEAAVRAAKSA